MKNKVILILGGTGALGKTLMKRYYQDNTIIVFSRDEHKHYELLKKSTAYCAPQSDASTALAIALWPKGLGWPTQTLWPYILHPTGHYNYFSLLRIGGLRGPLYFFNIRWTGV